MPLMAWAAHVLQWPVQRVAKPRGGANPKQPVSVRIGRLQLDSVKLESLVTADQLRRGEYVPGPCTHRPSHHESRLHPKSLNQPAREEGAEGVGGDWDEVVTR